MKKFLQCSITALFVFVVMLVTAVPMQAEAAPKVKLNKKSVTLYTGQSMTLKLKGAGTAEQKWTTSKKSVATVDDKGKVTAKKKGAAKISVTVGGKQYQCKVKVKNPGLNKSDITLEPQETFRLKLLGAKAKSWKSSNKKIAVVNKSGQIKAKEEGMARIYCRANNGKTYVCYVDVYEDDYDDDEDDEDDNVGENDDNDDDDNDDEHEHEWSRSVTTEASCTENGRMTSTCLVCGEVVTEDIPALGHDETNAIWEETEGATCITEGVRSFICQRLIGDEICDEVIFEEFIPMTDHDYVLESGSEASCTEAGWAMYSCTNCGEFYMEDIEASGHDEEHAQWEITLEATETSEGIKSLICQDCGGVIRTETIPKMGQGGLETPGEAYVISEEAKELFDQILQICLEENFEELCRLDYSSIDDVIDEEGENKIHCYDTAGNIVDGYFYDGETLKLKQNYTGIGIGIKGQELTIGYFNGGKASGELITMTVTVIDDYLMDENGTEFKNPEIKLSRMYVTNGVVLGEVTNSFYSINGQNIPQLNEQYTGDISLVRRSFMDNSYWEKFLFTGKVTYVCHNEDLSEEERYSFYLKDGLLDRELNVWEDGEWLDIDGNPCDILELFETDYEDDICVFISTDYFDKTKFDIVDVE